MADEIILRPTEAQKQALPVRWVLGVLSFVMTMVRYKPLGAAGLVIIVILMFTAVFADAIAPYGYNDTDRHEQFKTTQLQSSHRRRPSGPRPL